MTLTVLDSPNAPSVALKSENDLSSMVPKGGRLNTYAKFAQQEVWDNTIKHAAYVARLMDPSRGNALPSQLKAIADVSCVVSLYADSIRVVSDLFSLAEAIGSKGFCSKEAKEAFTELVFKIVDVVADIINTMIFCVKTVAVDYFQWSIVLDTVSRLKGAWDSFCVLLEFKETENASKEVQKLEAWTFKHHAWACVRQMICVAMNVIALLGRGLTAPLAASANGLYYLAYSISYKNREQFIQHSVKQEVERIQEVKRINV